MSAPIEHDFLHQPDFGMVRVQLKEGEKIMVEPSAMATMDSNTKLEAGFKGGFKATVMRGLAGESLIVSTYTGGAGGSELTLAPGPMGDCQHYRLDGSTRLMMERGAFLAHGEDVEVTGKFQGFSGFFSGEGLVLLQASGDGDLFFVGRTRDIVAGAIECRRDRLIHIHGEKQMGASAQIQTEMNRILGRRQRQSNALGQNNRR